MKLIKLQRSGPKWTPEEERMAASIVYRVLRDAPEPMSWTQLFDTVMALGDSLKEEDIIHAVNWMRGKGVQVRITPGRLKLGEEDPDHPAQIELVTA